MRLLYLTHRVPYAPNRGDRIRAYHVLRYLKNHGFAVCLVALAHDADEAAQAERLRSMVDEVHVIRVNRVRNIIRAGLMLATDVPLTHVLLDGRDARPVLSHVAREWSPDLVMAFCSGMARFAMEPPLDRVPFVLDMVDVDSFKWEALADEARPLRRTVYHREAQRLRRFETRAVRAADTTFVVSDRERDALRTIAPSCDPVVVPNGVDVEYFRNTGPTSSLPEVVFSGVFGYRPNEAAALWFINRVWPEVRRREPHAHLTLVGADPGAALRTLATRHGVEVTGTVRDVRPYLWRAALAVAPLHTARGVQNKVMEAMAAGLPSVVTPAVYEGLPETVRRACVLATDEGSFAAAIGDLLEFSPAERAGRAHGVAPDELTWERTLSPLREILVRAVERHSPSDMKRHLTDVPA